MKKKQERPRRSEEYSFFIILEICIWSFKNSVNPAVGSGKKKQNPKIRKSFAGSPSNSNELVEFDHKSKFPSHFALRRSSAVLYGGTLTGHQPSQPIPVVLETKKGGGGSGGGLSTCVLGDVCLRRG